MLTQEELLLRLNQLTLRYNLTWFDVKYDADKAINKINSFLGTKYPKLSTTMKSPNDTYSIPRTEKDAAGNITRIEDFEIIKEEFFHSVIIPYIASEILARDEEFTTIYNKYLLEMQEGLFDMFQKEFNSVPVEFRQNSDQGVFFGLDTAQGLIQHNERNLNIPTFQFRINYYPDNNNLYIPEGNSFTKDLNVYLYEKPAVLLFPQAPNNVFASIDGQFIYTFNGWTRQQKVLNEIGVTAANGYTVNQLTAGVTIIMRADLSLYAFWSFIRTLEITNLGLVNISSAARPNLINLIIPETIGSIIAKTIRSNFINDPAPPATDLLTQGIYLPKSILELQANAFNGFKGHTISLNQGLQTIRANAFADTPALFEIVIPDSVVTIEGNAFPVKLGKRLVIKTRVLEINKPAGWATVPANPLTQNYNTTSGSNTLTASSSANVTAGISVGQNITGTNIPANTVVTAVGSTTIQISNNATANATGTLMTFTGWYAKNVAGNTSDTSYNVEILWGYNG
jgi:hypothetical protein